MQKLVFTNGGGQSIDLTSGNFGITNWEGFSNTELNIQTQQVPFQDGGVYLDALMEQREISVTVAIQDNNDLSLRYELKRQLISALNPKLGEGVLVYTNDYLSRQIKAVPQLPIFENKNSNDAGTLKASVVFSCPSPYWEDMEDTEVEITKNEEMSIINNGDVPAQIKAEIMVQGEDFLLRNLSNKKKIKIKGLHDFDIEIDTNIGQKKIEKINNVLDYVSGGEFEGICAVNEKLYLVGSQFITIDIDGNIETIIIDGIKGKIYDIAYSEELKMFAICGHTTNNIGFIYTSKDGKIWTKQTTPTTTNNAYYLIAFEDNKFKVRYRVNNYITSADGVHWNIEATTINKDKKKIYQDGLYIRCNYVNDYSVIETSTDGTNWSPIYTLAYEYSTLNSLCFFWGNYYFIGNMGIILKTEDLSNFQYEKVFNSSNIIKYSCTNSSCYALDKYCGVFKTTNGKNWVNKPSPLPANEAIRFIVFDNNKIIISFLESGVYYSGNDGETFSAISLGEYVFPITPYYDGENVFILCREQIFKSVDKGENWNELDTDEIFDDFIDMRKFKNAYYIAGYKSNSNTLRIYKTTNFLTYTVVYSNSELTTEETLYYLRYAQFANDDELLMFIYAKGFIRTTNGTDWIEKDMSSMLPALNEIRSCAIINGTVWVCANTKIYKTINFNNYTEVPFVYIDYFNYCITQFKDMILFGGNAGDYGAISKYTQIENENIINELSNDSDMNFNLDVGNNQIILNMAKGIAKGSIKYRQKYIGV